MEGNYCYRYPHPAVTTDCVVFGYDGLHLNVLLIERGGEPYKGCWAFPGGFLNIDEPTKLYRLFLLLPWSLRHEWACSVGLALALGRNRFLACDNRIANA